EAKQSNDFNGAGNDFTLDSAASAGLTGSISPCTSTSTCSASASSATVSGTVTTLSPAPGDFIAASAGGVSYTCAGTYKTAADVFSFGVFNADGVPQPNVLVSVTHEVPKSVVEASGHTGASSWQLCYASPTLSVANAVP